MGRYPTGAVDQSQIRQPPRLTLFSNSVLTADEECNMTAGIEPHALSEPGYIVAWRSKKEFRAGKYLDEVMTYGEALEKAEQVAKEHPDMSFWAEHTPQQFEPH
jgi:hypothetical protein